MPSRKSHLKRKHGCRTCKKRKVRCDLGRPICHNCQRLERDCFYDSPMKPPPGPVPVSLSDIRNLELMHHYTASTCVHISDDPLQTEVWKNIVPSIAFQYPFLMHGILAASALHLRHEAPQSRQDELLNLASGHQEQALATFIPLLSSIDQQNCHALFALAILIGKTSYTLHDRPQTVLADEADFLDSVISAFVLLKGAVAVAVQAKKWLRAGELAPLMDDRHPLLDRNAPLEHRDISPEFEFLLQEIRARQAAEMASLDPAVFDCYRSSIEKLDLLSTSGSPGNPAIGLIIGWPVLQHNLFMSRMMAKDPAALVILAHYGAVLHRLRRLWWLDGVGAKLVGSVKQTLPNEWLPLLSKPITEILQS